MTLDAIKESNRLKKEACEECMELLKGVIPDEQLERFEGCFYRATANAIFEKKRQEK